MKTAPHDEKCPDQGTLVKFLQGKLVPPDLDQCESHVEICEVCHDTLRGLNPSDTLSEYVAKAMHPAAPSTSDAEVVESLVQRLVKSDVVTGVTQTRIGANNVMHDRAAEVLRHVQPDQDDCEGLGMLAGFRLLELIGAGGTGVVFRAHDLSLDRIVALKVLRPSLGDIARERFVAEARAAASIDHENVVTIYQVGQQDRLAWMAMRWLPGETLESLLLREGPLEESQVRSFAIQIAQGLRAAHARQLVHRDIKPANIWIGEPDDKIRILDFGLVRITDNDPSLTATGMLAGTPNFMSPEQAQGQELDARSDLFSLGCVIYQMLTGKLPFGSPSILATLQAIQTQQPSSAIEAGADCQQELSDLTHALLEKQPANRIPSAEALIDCLQQQREDWPVRVARYPAKMASRSAQSESAMQKSKGGRGAWVAAILLGLIAFPMWLFAPQIIRVATNHGELVIETEDENVKVEVRENGELIRVLDTNSGSSFDVRSGNYEFSAARDGDKQTRFVVTPAQVVMNRGEREIVRVTRVQPPVVGGIPTKKPTQGEVVPLPRLPSETKSLYSGKGFEEWIRIAQTDKEPKTKANAIKACGVLCESEAQIEQFKVLLSEFLAEHATIVIGRNGSDSAEYLNGFSSALAALPVEHVVDFVESQVTHGSDGALVWIESAFYHTSFNDDRGHEYRTELDQQLKSRAMSVLELFPQRKTHEGSLSIFTHLLSLLDTESEENRKRVSSLMVSSASLRQMGFYNFPAAFLSDELLTLIESDFFSPDSTQEIRDQFLHTVELNYAFQPPNNRFPPEWEVEILGKLLVDQLVGDAPLEFGNFSKIRILSGREQSGAFNGGGGGFSGADGVEKFEGSAVVARRLLNMILQRMVHQFDESQGKSELAIKFAPVIRDKILSQEKYRQSKMSHEFVELQLDQDLKAVLSLALGKKANTGSMFESYERNWQTRQGGVF